MLIVIISLCLFIIGIIGIIIYGVINDNTWRELTWLLVISLVFAILFGTIGLTTGLFSIFTQVNKDIDYEKVLYEKQVLEYRLENCEDLQGNELLYADITKFNNELRNTKHWANNLWTSWFYNDKVATIDYIEIGNIDKGD